MPRVQTTHHGRLRSHRSSTADRTRAAKKKKPYTVFFEPINKEKKALHTTLSYSANPPPGYSFVPSGRPDLTKYCKDVCRRQELHVHIVSLKPKNKAVFEPDKIASHVHRIGHHFPDEVVAQACDELGYHVRHGEFHKRNQPLVSARLARTLAEYGSRLLPHDRPATDTETKDQIEASVRDLFPKIPVWDLNAIVHHAFRKGTGRVGNAKDVSLVRRVQLAVVAHIRHNYTSYDNLLKVVSWHEARFKVEPVSLAKLKEWRDENDTDQVEETFREVIILDDDDDDDDDEDDGDDDDGYDDDSDVTMSGEESDSSVEVISSRVTRAPVREPAREPQVYDVDYTARSVDRRASRAPAREPQVNDVDHIARLADRHIRQAPADEAHLGRLVRVPTYDERYVNRPPAGERQVERIHQLPRAEEVYAARAPARELLVNDVAYSHRPQEGYPLRASAGSSVLQPYASTRASYTYPAVQLRQVQPHPLPQVYHATPHRPERPLRMVDHGQEFNLIPIQEPVGSPRRMAPATPPRRMLEQDLVLPSIEHDQQYGRRPAGHGY